ncbi:MAG: biotin--[acetyl-CoA-carboxylase] ligase [Candidatus Izemoplasmatales bacterium]
MKIIEFESLDSTNIYAKSNYEKLNHLDCIIAKNQTHGKGRKDNLWFSNNDSLTFSMLLKDNLSSINIDLIPLFAGYALHKALSEYTNNLEIKWPNDLLLNRKKTSGILVESIFQPNLKAIIIGIGLNLNQEFFPDEIASKATSLKKETNIFFNKEKILNKFLQVFEDSYQEFLLSQTKIIDYCNKYLAYKNELIQFKENNKLIIGKCLYISILGHLNIEVNKQIKAICSGEIESIKPL